MAVLAVVLCPFAGAAPAKAAAPSPDPAPQAAPAGNSASPGPDPAPQKPAQNSTAAGSPGPSVAVLPHPAVGGVVVAAPSSSQPPSTSTAATTAPVIQAPSSAKPAVHHRQRRINRHLVARPRHPRKPVARARVITFRPTVAARAPASGRNGMLLLLGAVAMLVLALASASMVRLLTRMEEVAS